MAVETLQRYASRHTEALQKAEVKREGYFGDIVSGTTDPDAAKRLVDTLVTLGYVPKDNLVVLDRYMDKVIDR